MQEGIPTRSFPIGKLQNRQRGYILITLMLFFTVLAIAALAVLPNVVHQAQRDREEEMIHRGLQYSRAVRRYYKKFGRYPTRVEELENTNNLRFLRKRYKDPITNKDFKFLRMGDPALMQAGFGQNMGQGMGMLPGQGGMNMPGGGGPRPGGGSRPGSGVQNMPQMGGGLPMPGAGQQNPPLGDAGGDAAAEERGDSDSSSNSASGPGLGSQVFGGGPILGVVSTSKGKTIREFCKKNRFSDWLFVYDPNSDRSGMLSTPFCPRQFGEGTGGIAPGSGEGNSPIPSPQGGPQQQPQQLPDPRSMPPDE